MKKFLIILLIALVASATITFDAEDLNGFFNKTKGWGIKFPSILDLSGKSKDYYKWLKDHGYWDTLVEHAKEYGKPYAVRECVGLIKDRFCCSELVDKILYYLSMTKK